MRVPFAVYQVQADDPPLDLPTVDPLAILVDTCPHGQSGLCGCDGRPRTCTRSGSPEPVDRATTCLDCRRAELTG